MTGVINGSTRGLLDLRVRALDERQRAERSRVAATAQQVMLWLLLAVTVAAGTATVKGADVEGFLFPVLFTVFVVHWLMPLWVAGLSAEDEPADRGLRRVLGPVPARLDSAPPGEPSSCVVSPRPAHAVTQRTFGHGCAWFLRRGHVPPGYRE